MAKSRLRMSPRMRPAQIKSLRPLSTMPSWLQPEATPSSSMTKCILIFKLRPWSIASRTRKSHSSMDQRRRINRMRCPTALPSTISTISHERSECFCELTLLRRNPTSSSMRKCSRRRLPRALRNTNSYLEIQPSMSRLNSSSSYQARNPCSRRATR